MIPIDLLIAPITSDEIYEKMLSVLETAGVPARSWRDGGVGKFILSALSEVGFQGATITRDCVAGMFLAFGSGDYLTDHAEDVYDVPRIAATFASAADGVRLVNAGGGVWGPYGANEFIVRSSNTNARFKITEGFTLGAFQTLDLDVQAIEAGSESTVGVAEIDEIETPVELVTVTNTVEIIGRDAESDEELRKRCRAKKGTWSEKGPVDAYEFAALSALMPDGSPTGITRVKVSRYDSRGLVTVVCATPTGTPTANELQAVRDNIRAKVKPDTVTVIVAGAVQILTSHSIVLWANGGVPALLLANAEEALTNFYATYPIGGLAKIDGGQGYLYLDKIAAVVIGSSEEVFDVDFNNAPTDTALAPDEVAINTTTIEVRVR